ncbi:MAG: sulfite exporter TauE/SafE family protein [Thermodesulfobacteriota bacterium]|nr:sulfite exporter TauE/SafE family protein [Thermodesulfobacteriota bacterium]
MLSLIIMLFIGLVTGAMTGLTGASGVAIVVPLVNLVLGLSMHEAIGTSLMVDVIASIAVAWTYFRAGNIDLRSGLWVAAGSIVGAQFGADMAIAAPGNWLQTGFGVSCIIMGIMLWRRGLNKEPERKHGPMSGSSRYLMALVLGLGVGIITGLIGAGGGVMIMLVLFFILGMPIHIAIGTSTLMMTLTALSGTIGYGLHGSLNLQAATVIGISAVAGGIMSARLANRINARILSRIVGAIFTLLGALMIALGLSPLIG